MTILQLVTRQTILTVSRKNKSHRHLGNKYHVMQIRRIYQSTMINIHHLQPFPIIQLYLVPCKKGLKVWFKSMVKSRWFFQH